VHETLSLAHLGLNNETSTYFFFFLIKKGRPRKLTINILAVRDYNSICPLEAVHNGPKQ
jgi:hypothetical protein